MTPDDVYALVTRAAGRTHSLLLWALFLMVVNALGMITAAVMAYKDRTARAAHFKQNKEVLEENRRMLGLAEKHGVLSDANKEQVISLIHQEMQHLAEAKTQLGVVERKVDRVGVTVTRVEEKMPDMPSGVLTPIPQPPLDPANSPKRRAEDKKP